MNARIAVLCVLAASCAPRSVESEGGEVIESAPDCAACLTDMVACVSTSRGDAQFMECRDLFGACQTKADLEPGACQSPNGEGACALCAKRLDACVATDPEPARCGEDLDVCLDRLDVAGASCAPATGATAGVGGGGVAGGAGGATDATGGGALGGLGGAGGGEGVISCHGPCDIGGALVPACSPCVAAVCAADAYCCTTAWDKWCVTGAEAVTECGCGPPPCTHDECTNGVALAAACSACATEVCDKDATCCAVEWVPYCASIAQTVASCGCDP